MKQIITNIYGIIATIIVCAYSLEGKKIWHIFAVTEIIKKQSVKYVKLIKSQ